MESLNEFFDGFIRGKIQRLVDELMIATPKMTYFSSSEWLVAKDTEDFNPSVKKSRKIGYYIPKFRQTFTFNIGAIKTIDKNTNVVKIYNMTEYIGMLNAGWSPQAETEFIESIIETVL